MSKKERRELIEDVVRAGFEGKFPPKTRVALFGLIRHAVSFVNEMLAVESNQPTTNVA
jgi:hypothetical protein